MGQKCEGNCGLWVLNKILKKTYPAILKKIVGAVWEIPIISDLDGVAKLPIKKKEIKMQKH